MALIEANTAETPRARSSATPTTERPSRCTPIWTRSARGRRPAGSTRHSGGPCRCWRRSRRRPHLCAELCARPPDRIPPGAVSRTDSRVRQRARPVSRVLCRVALRRARRWPSICGRRSPDGSCGRPEGWAARLSPGEPGVALLFGLAPGRACRVSLRSGPGPVRHRHCGAGPRLSADGSYPLPRAVELGLSSRRRVAPPARGHPAASLTEPILPLAPVRASGGRPRQGRRR